MKQVLFITYFFPPRPGIGSVRAGQIARYLPEFGWDVTVLTASLPGFKHDGVRVIETPALDINKTLRRVFGFGARSAHAAFGIASRMYQEDKGALQRMIETAGTAATYVTNKFGWYGGAINVARALAAQKKFDAVLSTSPPESAHIIAAALAQNLPWVADLRDLWDGNSAVKGRFETRLNRLLEPRFLSRARSLVTVSDPLAEQLRARYGKPVARIRNAFDAQEWTGVPFSRNERCTIFYAGQLYDGRRDPRMLFEAAGALLRGGALRPHDLEIVLYTTPHQWLTRLVALHGIEEIVSIRPQADRAKIMELERASDLLWVILFDGERDAGVLTGKLFEYLGARRPILVTGGPNSCAIDKVLEESGAGVRARTSEAIGAQVLQAVGRHRAIPSLSAEQIEQYEVRHLARELSAVLDAAAGLAPAQAAHQSHVYAHYPA